MIIREHKVLNIKTGKVIVMNDNSIKALKKHNLWHGFDILPELKPIEQPIVNEFVDTSNIVITNVDESNVDESPIFVDTIIDESIVDEIQNVEPEKPKRKNKKS